MHRNTVGPLSKTMGIGASRALSLSLRRLGVGPLAFVCCVAPLACSATENTQPRNTPSAQGGSTGGSNVTAQGGSSTATTGGVVTTGGVAAGTGGSATTGGSGTGGSVATGGATVGGSGGASQGGTSGSAGSNAGATAKGGASATGGSSGAAGSAGKSSSGGTSSGGSSSGGGGAGGVAGSAGSSGAAGSGGAATCPGFVFCDTFEDGNLTANPAWIATAGAFSVVDDGGSKVLKQTGSSEAWAYSGSATWTDVTIQARVKVLDFGGTSSSNCAGIIARWQGSSNPNYMASLCAKGTVGVYKDGGLVDEVNGTKVANIVANTWYALKFKVAGKPGSVSLVLSIDDAPLITITDSDTSTPVTAGYVGVGSKKAFTIEYDDLKVSSP